MNIRTSLFLTVVLAMPVFAAESVPAAAADPDGARPTYGQQGAISAACKADPEKCRKEMQARREQMCAQNPEQCREMKVRLEQRRAQCQADPAKCEQERQVRMDERFRKADADGNGTLSRSETEKGMPMLARRFDAIDANKDGQITRDERAAARKARHGARPQQKI